MSLIKTELSNLYRDPNSKAIINVDDIAREEFKKKARRQKEESEFFRSEIEELKNSVSNINNLKEEIAEIRSMLECLCKNKEQ